MWNLHGKITADEAEVMEFFNLKYPPMVKALDDTDLYKFSMDRPIIINTEQPRPFGILVHVT